MTWVETVADDFDGAAGNLPDWTTQTLVALWQRDGSSNARGNETYQTSAVSNTEAGADRMAVEIPLPASLDNRWILIHSDSPPSNYDGVRLVAGPELYYNGAYSGGYWGGGSANESLRIEDDGSGGYDIIVDGVTRVTGATPTQTPGAGQNYGGLRGDNGDLYPSFLIEEWHDGGGTTADGAAGVGLAIAGTARKSTGTSGGLTLDLGTSPDQAKAARTDGPIDTDLTIEGIGVKAADSAGSVSVDLALDAVATAYRIALDALGLTLDVTAAATRHSTAAAVMDLALDLTADTTKAAAVAGTLGLVLDAAGGAQSHADGQVDGDLALALVLVATAVKSAEASDHAGVTLAISGTAAKHTGATGSIGLVLDTPGTSDVTIDAVSGTLDVLLAISGTATRRSSGVGTLDLVVGLVGLVRRLGATDGPTFSADTTSTFGADTTSTFSADAHLEVAR